METKNYNGFSTQEQYEKCLKKIEFIRGFYDEYDRNTIDVFKDGDKLEICLDQYCITFSCGRVEIATKTEIVDNDIIDIACAVKKSIVNGEFKDFI